MHKWFSIPLLLSGCILFSFAGCSSEDASSTATPGHGCSLDEDCATVGEVCVDETCQPDPDLSEGIDQDGAADMGEIDNGFGGGDEPTEVGAVIDSFCGIDAYQNGSSVTAVHGSSPYGYKWQCTELAYRFTCQHYNMCEKKVGKYGNAKAWFTNYKDPVLKQLTRYENGGSEPPRPGDVIVWGNGTYGHVAIVKTVLDDAIQVLEQNYYNGSHVYAMTKSGGSYSIKNALGWMRVPGSVQACDGGQGNAPATATLTSPAPGAQIEGPFQVVGSASDLDGLQKVTVTLNSSLGAAVCNGDCAGTAQSINTAIDPAQYGIASGSQITIAVWAKDALGFITGPLAVRTISWQSGSSDEVCGDGSCAGSENQTTCCLDCGCPSTMICQGNTCIDGGSCGDGQCSGSETQASCCFDCGCPQGMACQGNTCVNAVQCGDGVCTGGEDCASCSADCGCSGGLVCQGGQCVAACSYSGAAQNEDYSCQGGVVMNIQGSIDGAGNVTISATKIDGSTIGSGTYYVLVFDPNTGGGSQHCKALNTEKAQMMVSGSPTKITFPTFPSLLTCGGAEKAYCVTKLDGGDKAFWCSDQYQVQYQ